MENEPAPQLAAYTMTMVIENLELDEGVRATLKEHFPDLVAVERDGFAFVTGSAEGKSQKTAGQGFARVFKDHFPDATPVRLDQDLVSVSEIARRLDRSPYEVSALVDGTEGPGGFPLAIGVVATDLVDGGIRIWPWAAVVKWLKDDLGVDLGLTLLDPEASAAVDANLASRRLIGVDHSKGGL